MPNVTRWSAWSLSLALIAVPFVLDLNPKSADLEPAWLFMFLWCGFVSYLMDFAWMHSFRRWPTYKRHSAIFLLLALFIVCWGRGSGWCAGLFGMLTGFSVSCIPFVLGSRSRFFGWERGSNARPDPSRRLVVIADPHWCEELTGLRQATMSMPDADWLFLGDVFNVWVGTSGFETDANRNFLWWVSERRRTGHWVGLWTGNREYFLDSLSDKFDFMGEGVGGCLWGETFAFEHGDLINTMDRCYRIWNLISRSAPVWLLALVLPPPIGRRLASYLESHLRPCGDGFRGEFPADEFQSAIHGSGMDFFIAGHFHKLEVLHKGISIEWASNGKFLVLQDGEFTFHDFSG